MTKKQIAKEDDAPEASETVAMVRPEDRSADPVIAQVNPNQVEHWKSHGWVIKE